MAMMECAASRMLANNDDILMDGMMLNQSIVSPPKPSAVRFPIQQQQQANAPAIPPPPPPPIAVPQKNPEQALVEVMEAMGSGQTEVKVKDAVSLLLAAAAQANKPPQPYFISQVLYEGDARKDSVFLHCTIVVILLEDCWTTVPLFTSSVAVVSSSTTDPKQQQSKVAVVGDFYSLVASGSGTYTIELDLLVPYATTRKTGVQLTVPKATRNELRFTVPESDVLVKIDPCCFSTVSSIPGDSKTVVVCPIPPTTTLSINWTEKIEQKQTQTTSKTAEKIVATVEQNVVCSIGEGVMGCKAQLTFNVTSGQISLFLIEVDPRVHILHVEGCSPAAKQHPIPVRNWEVERASKYSSFVESHDLGTPPLAQFLRVWLDYGIEQSYTITVISELPLLNTTALRVPNFMTVSPCEAHSITRETGVLCIEAKTNIEINEQSHLTHHLNRLDPQSELPDSSPVLAYKFMTPVYQLVVSVQKHDDASVLVAAVDSALFEVTVSEAGCVMNRLVFSVRNTQRQFLRIKASKGAVVWSAFVDSEPVRPASDSDGLFMVPLKKSGSPMDKTNGGEFKVSFTYLTTIPPLHHQGQLTVEMACCDLPISHLFVSVYVPEGYRYGEFNSQMRSVIHFTKSPPSAKEMGYKQQQQQQQQQQEANDYDNVNFKKAKVASKSIGWGSYMQQAAVRSVAVEMPTTSIVGRFEQLLVTDLEGSKTVTVSYVKQQKLCIHRKSEKSCAMCLSKCLICCVCCCEQCCCPSHYNPI